MKKLLTCLLACLMFATAALAETVTLEGTVVATQSTAVLSTTAGTISEVIVQAGDRVSAGQEIASLLDTTTYAEVSGTVKLFGATGESVETLSERYGGVLYIEQDCKYTVSASTRNAYDDPANKIIHPGETVYILCTCGDHEGIGFVTAVKGTSYTVEVTEGEFEDNESAYIYRNEDCASASRLGKGSVAYNAALACTGSGTGTITRLHVTDGMHVNEGDPLFSTLESAAYDQCLRANVSGTVGSISVAPGDAVEQGALIATIQPAASLRLEILADEIDLRSLALGQEVTLTFTNGTTVQGQVERISGLQYVQETTDEESTTDDTAYFPVYVTFPADETIACGMTAKVSIEK